MCEWLSLWARARGWANRGGQPLGREQGRRSWSERVVQLEGRAEGVSEHIENYSPSALPDRLGLAAPPRALLLSTTNWAGQPAGDIAIRARHFTLMLSRRTSGLKVSLASHRHRHRRHHHHRHHHRLSPVVLRILPCNHDDTKENSHRQRREQQRARVTLTSA